MLDWFRRAVHARLARLAVGNLRVLEAGSVTLFQGANAAKGSPSGPDGVQPHGAGLSAAIEVRDPRFYRAVMFGGALGGAESYLRGDWDSPDLTAAMRLLARNEEVLAGVEGIATRAWDLARRVGHWLRRNTRAGSRRNIAAHYDLSNEFFGLMLDPTMTYSCGIFPSPDASLEDASREKYERICRKMQLSADDHLLEIGTGWGGFAEHAARHYGCRVTTTTISDEQFRYAEERFRHQPWGRRITLLRQDYRDLRGMYDKLVSIEMIEAVGEKFLPVFFRRCSQLLAPHGMMALQAITIPDHRYESYRRSVDFIQRYIFPGGFLPSMNAMTRCLAQSTDFRLFHSEDFGIHYAETLAAWRSRFWQHIDRVRALGFDQRFVRMWQYYLCYCEAGFRERQIGVSQLLLTKPACRRAPVLGAI